MAILAVTLLFLEMPITAQLGSNRITANQKPQGTTTAQGIFKNLQVLKGTSADQLYATMRFMNESLGVTCEYCHITNAYEKDDRKPKLAARRMILMQIDINKHHFNGQRRVTCYSCHRGAVEVPQR